MSYLLIKKGGQKPSSSLPCNRSNGQHQHRRNPAVFSANSRPGGGGGGNNRQWRNPSSQSGINSFPRPSVARAGTSIQHHDDGEFNQNEFNAHHRQHGMTVVTDSEGQVQLQRMAAIPPQRQQQVGSLQQQEQQKNKVIQGLVSMDEVYADLQILEQQRQESERKLTSARLHQKQKKAELLTLEGELCQLKCQNGGLRVELERAANQLSLRHRELLEAQTKAECSRKDTHRIDTKLKRVIGVARLFGTYQNKVENAIIALNETETRLNFAKGQEASKLQSALVRRDDVIRRRDLLIKTINSNTTKVRSITDEVSKIRTEIVSYEQDLSAAQRMESQTKLRVETIEHEVALERTRHEEAMAKLISITGALDESKVNSSQSSIDKKTAIELKKSELQTIWVKCNELLKSEGRNGFPEAIWEIDQAPSLDVARVCVRVTEEEANLDAKLKERDQLRLDVADLDARVSSNTTKATEKQVAADTLQKNSQTTGTEEMARKIEISRAVEDADCECREVEKLRDSILDLTVVQEKDTTDLKMKLTSEESRLSTIEIEIANIREEVAEIEMQSLEHRERECEMNEKVLKEVAVAKKTADVIKGAFEHAQRQADRFSTLPDGELALQTTQLDEAEQEILDVANLERSTVIALEPLLEKFTLDFNSEISFEDQKKAGVKSLRKACLNFLEDAKIYRRARLESAKEMHLREQVQPIKDREEYFARIDQETIITYDDRAFDVGREKRSRQSSSKSASVVKRKTNNAKLRKDRHEGSKTAEIERHYDVEVATRCRKAEEMQSRRKDRVTGSDNAVHSNAANKGKLASKGFGRDEKCATDKATELKRRKDDTRTQESRKKRKTVRVLDDDKSRQERGAHREFELETMRVRSKEMQERLKAEEKIRDSVKRKENQRDDDKGHHNLGSMNPLRDTKEFGDSRSNAIFGLKMNDRKSYGRGEDSRSKNMRAKMFTSRAERSFDDPENSANGSIELTLKTKKNDTKEQKRKQSSKLDDKILKAVPAMSASKRAPDEPVDNDKHAAINRVERASQLSLSSAYKKSAIKRTGLKISRTASGVRFDATADRPKLDIEAGVQSKFDKRATTKPAKKNNLSLSISSTQTSGISSCESGGRRRKKASIGGKSKAAILAMKGFEDDGCFL